MAELIESVKAVSERLGVQINATKTKVMVVDRAESLLNSTALSEYEKVNTFTYRIQRRFIGGNTAPNRTAEGSNDQTTERHMQKEHLQRDKEEANKNSTCLLSVYICGRDMND